MFELFFFEIFSKDTFDSKKMLENIKKIEKYKKYSKNIQKNLTLGGGGYCKIKIKQLGLSKNCQNILKIIEFADNYRSNYRVC